MTPRILTPVFIAADALLAVVLGVFVPLLCTSAIWAAAGLTGDWGVALATAVGAWALSLGGDLVVTLDEALLGPVGLSQPISFGIGLAPLALTLTTVWLAYRSGARLRDDDVPIACGLVGPLVFGLTVWGVCAAASQPSIAIDGLGAGIVGALIYLVSAAVGAQVWQRIPHDVVAHFSAGWGKDGLVAMARGAGIMIAGLVGLGSLALLAAVVIGMGRILTIFQTLHLDVVGAITFGLGQLALIPNAIAWAIAWLLGPGFSFGAGSSVSPTATNVGPLPLVPILGALPEGIPPIAIVIIVLPVAVGVLAGLAMRLAPGADVWNTGWRRFVTPFAAAAAAAICIALFALASGGAVGPGRLAEIGPHAGWVVLAAFGTLAVGALTGAYVPLAEVEEATASGRDADAARPGRADTATPSKDGHRGPPKSKSRLDGARHEGRGRADDRDGDDRDDSTAAASASRGKRSRRHTARRQADTRDGAMAVAVEEDDGGFDWEAFDATFVRSPSSTGTGHTKRSGAGPEAVGHAPRPGTGGSSEMKSSTSRRDRTATDTRSGDADPVTPARPLTPRDAGEDDIYAGIDPLSHE